MIGQAQDGQASVELVALLPLALVVVLAIAQLLAAGAVHEQADGAAVAGAAALLQERDPVAEARAAIPDWARGRVVVSTKGRRIEVRIRPRAIAGPLSGLLGAVASADAGPPTPGAAAAENARRRR